MLVIGIAGGVASGKSLVSAQLQRLGARLLDADRVGHEVLTESEVVQAIRDRWGPAVLRQDGQVDRAAVARIVFGPPPEGPQQLAYLERLTHPRIEQRLGDCLAQWAAEGELKAVVLDAAVMFKAGWDKFCDKIVFVEAPRQQRLARALQRGWSEGDFQAREAAQQVLQEKRMRADVIIDNSGSPQHTEQQVRRFWRTLD